MLCFRTSVATENVQQLKVYVLGAKSVDHFNDLGAESGIHAGPARIESKGEHSCWLRENPPLSSFTSNNYEDFYTVFFEIIKTEIKAP